MEAERRLPARRERSTVEEMVNSVTHGAALALSIAGLVVLVVLASLRGEPMYIVACSIYGATLVVLFGASTLYHGFRSPVAKRRLRRLDHSCIFLLIAGTYTPYTLTQLRGGWGWSLFGVVWGIAAVGVIIKIFYVDKFRIAAPIVYILMGWLIVIAIKPTIERVPFDNLMWLLAGGLAGQEGQKKSWEDQGLWHSFRPHRFLSGSGPRGLRGDSPSQGNFGALDLSVNVGPPRFRPDLEGPFVHALNLHDIAISP